MPDPVSGVRAWNRAADARIHAAGLVALTRALGEEGAGRFLQLVAARVAGPGAEAGDYTAERHRWLDGLTVEELAAEIMAAQEAGHLGRPTPADCDAGSVDSKAPTPN